MNKDDLELINTDTAPLQGWHVFHREVKEVEVEMTPIIFKKKLNDKAKTIPLNTPNFLGHIRHYPATTKEWSSSIYAYNNNNDVKSLPVLDKNLVKLIKSFLNFYHQSEKLKSKRILLRFRRVSLKKIFVSKAELKHTNSKVIINIHVYNIQKRLLMKEIDRMRSVLCPSISKSILEEKLRIVKSLNNRSPLIYVILMELMKKEKLLIIKNKNKCINKGDIPYFHYLMKARLYSAYIRDYEFDKEKFNHCNYNLDYRSINEWDFPSILSLIEDIEKEISLLDNLLPRASLNRGLFAYPRDLKKVSYATPLFDSILKQIRLEPQDEGFFNMDFPYLYIPIWLKYIENELELIRYYKFLSDLYDHKFNCLIPRLKKVISKIYKKKVEFNIVSLKHMYLNSDILSQAIALKLKDRDNRLWRVLKSCLGMVQLPNTDTLKEKSEWIRGESLLDKIKNLDIDPLTTSLPSPLKEAKQDNDSLNQLLFGIIPHPPSCIGDKQDNITLEKACEGAEKHSSTPSIINGLPQLYSPEVYYNFFFFNCLKYKAIGGVRLEAKGRLTRRFTASRSVFKLKWKGGLKNIDSSYKGLSAVMLRGHAKSNVQYTLINSKNRNGAYGVKSWVSGK